MLPAAQETQGYFTFPLLLAVLLAVLSLMYGRRGLFAALGAVAFSVLWVAIAIASLRSVVGAGMLVFWGWATLAAFGVAFVVAWSSRRE